MSVLNKRKEFESMETATLKFYVWMDSAAPKRELWDILEVTLDRLASFESDGAGANVTPGSNADMELADLREIEAEVSHRLGLS